MFAIANYYGYVCYLAYTTGFFYSEVVREQYRSHYGSGENLVSIHDVLFAGHAFIIAFIFLIQILIYRQPQQQPRPIWIILSAGLTTLIVAGGILVYSGNLTMMMYLNLMSYLKLVLTVAKYVPQVYLNWSLKSTVGWSIYNVLFDLGGGFASITQLLLDGYRSGNMIGIQGTISKLLLGAISVTFDIIFILQHFVWYRLNNHDSRIKEAQDDYGLNCTPKTDTDDSEVVECTEIRH